MDTSGQHFVTKVGKILSRQKYPDRFSVATVYRPQEPAQRARGIFYITMEIMTPDPAMADVSKLIIDTLIESYYKSIDDPLTALEESLKRVNEGLARLAEEGETGWVGKINAIVGVLIGNILHLTQVGTAEAYMIRNNKIIHVSEGLATSAERPHPLKTFLNIASGDLKISDRVIFSTAELFYHFSQEELRRIITKFSPASAATYIVKVLKKEEIESLSSLVFELTTEEIVSDELIDDGNEEEALRELDKKPWQEYLDKAKPYLEKTKPFFNSLKKSVIRGFKNSSAAYKEKVAPKVKDMAGQAKEKIGHSIEGLKKETEKSEKVKKAEEYLTDASKKVGDFWKEAKKPKNKSRLYVFGAIVIIGILIFTVIGRHNKQNVNLAREEIKKIYVEVKDKETAAKTALLYQDTAKAKILINEALNSINKIKDSSYLKSDISALYDSLSEELDRVNNVTRINKLTPLADFSTIDTKIKVDGVFAKASSLYTFDITKNKVYEFDMVSAKAASFVDVVDPGIFSTGTLPTDSNTIVYITKTPDGLVSLDLEKKETTTLSSASGVAFIKAKAIASYFNNIYLLSDDGKIVKHTKSTEGYSKGIDYMTNAELKDAISIKVDGNVWAVKNDGSIVKFLSGAKQPFSLSGVPTPENVSVTDLFTEVNLNMLYVLDAKNKRVIEFDKNGNYMREFIADVFEKTTRIYIDQKLKKLYTLSENKIYEVGL